MGLLGSLVREERQYHRIGLLTRFVKMVDEMLLRTGDSFPTQSFLIENAVDTMTIFFISLLSLVICST